MSTRQRTTHTAAGAQPGTATLPKPRHTFADTDLVARLTGLVWAAVGAVWAAWTWLGASTTWTAWMTRMLVPGVAWLAGAHRWLIAAVPVLMASGPGGLVPYTRWWTTLSWPVRAVLWPVTALVRPWIEPLLARLRNALAGVVAPPPPTVPLSSTEAATQAGPSAAELSEAPSKLNELQRLALRVLRRAGPVPNHVAFIMDGNRRFAKQRNIAKETAHARGFDKLIEVLESCLELGVSIVSVYAFSIENFKRPQEEVQALMDLAQAKFEELRTNTPLLHKFGVRVRVIGDLSLLSEPLRAAVDALDQATASNRRAMLFVCFPYTSQDELATAIRKICEDVQTGELAMRDIDEKAIEARLMTAGAPPVDLLVRTSGEKRLSDYMLWQSATAQLQFEPVLWPDISFMNLLTCMARYMFSERVAPVAVM